MLIGELSKKSGFSRDTLRYYEKLDMIAPNYRREGNYREYGTEVVSVLLFIKRTKKLGFTLAEIKGMITSQNQPYSCETASRAVTAKIKKIDTEIDKLDGYKQDLTALMHACESNSMLSKCDGFETLWQGAK